MLDSRPMEDPVRIRQDQIRHRIRSLRWVILGIAGLMVAMAVVDHLLAPPGDSRAFISLSMGGVSLMLFLLFRAHGRWWGIPLLVVCVLASGAWASYSYGSVRAAAALALPGAVVLAGTYLNTRALAVTTLAALLLLAGLTWAEARGQLPAAGMLADARFWLMGSVIIVVIGALLYHLRRMTDEAHLRLLFQTEDRVRLEYERDRSLRRFRRIFELNPTALLIQAADTQTVLEINPAFERTLGWRGEQLAGQQATALWADEQQWREHASVLARQGCTEWQSARWLRADGQSADVLVFSELSEDHDGLVILTTVTDAR